MDAERRVERAARALLRVVDERDPGLRGYYIDAERFNALRAALAAPEPAPVAGVWVRPERDFVKWAEKCVNGPETLRAIQGAYGQGLVDAQNAAPAPAQAGEAVARAAATQAVVLCYKRSRTGAPILCDAPEIVEAAAAHALRAQRPRGAS